MSRLSWLQSAFTGGEFDASVKGRLDAQRYKDAAETILNFVVRPQGYLERRPGTKMVTPTKTATGNVKLIPFEFSTEQAYILEFGDLYIRIHKDHGVVTLTGTTITAATKADPVVVTAASHGLSNGDRIIITGVGGMTQLNNREFIVANKTADTVELQDIDAVDIDGTGYDTYTTGGMVAEVFEVVTTYTSDEVPDLQYTQSADVLYIAHRDHPPAKLSRTGHTTWTLTDIDFQEGPFLNRNNTNTTFTPSAGTAPGSSCTITASAVTGVNDGAGFQSSDVGRLLRMKTEQGAEECWGKITAVADTTHCTLLVKGTHSTSTSATKGWRLGVFYIDNYPSSVSFHESRLWWGGTLNYPSRLDSSFISDFEDYRPTEIGGSSGSWTSTVTEACACAFTLSSNQVNEVHWLASSFNGLVAGTRGGSFIIRASNQGEGITPLNVNAKEASTYGSVNIRPVKTENSHVFIERSSLRVLDLNYYFDVDGFRSSDMTLLARHIGISSISDLAFTHLPNPIVWVVNGDGELCGMSYERDENGVRAAWHRHQLGGQSDSGGAIPQVTSIASIPTPDGENSELWAVVERYINGASVRFIEFVMPLDDGTATIEDLFFVDCGLTYDGSPTTSISGLYHLEGETVQIFADGATVTEKTVTNGKITLDASASVVQVGYAYDSDLKTLKVEGGSEDGTALSKKQRIEHLAIMFHRSSGTVKVGRALDDTNNWSLGSAFYTDIMDDTFNGDFSTYAQVAVRVSDPNPCTILAVNAQVSTYGKG